MPAYPVSPGSSPNRLPSEMGLKPGFRQVRCDFHTHTINDPRDKHVWHTAEELIQAAQKAGIEVLAVTLHGRQFFPSHWAEYAAERGVLLIPGVEQDIAGCHVLLLNFERDAANGIREFQELAPERRPENLVIAAHPFFPGEICLGEKVIEHGEVLDALEVTGFYHPVWNPNLKARQVARQMGKPVVGNSDTHTLDQFGATSSLVQIPAEMDLLSDFKAGRKAVLSAIKQGDVDVLSRPLGAVEMGTIAFKVIGRGHMPWIDYKKTRGQVKSD